MDFNIHAGSYPTKLILNYLGPRESPYKAILDEWLGKHKRGGLLLRLSPSDKKDILSRIPLGITKEGIKKLWELDLKPAPNYEKYIKTPEQLWAVPIRKNPFFVCPPLHGATWKLLTEDLGFSNLGSLVNTTTSKLFTEIEMKRHLLGSNPQTAPLTRKPKETQWNTMKIKETKEMQ